MPRKKLAIITARADDRAQKDIICGAAQAARAANADVVVFTNIYNHWSEDEILTFENVIYDLFDPACFDGAIITAEAFMNLSVLSDVFGRIRRAKLPAVVTGGEAEGFRSLYCDDVGDLERICGHLITEHGFTDIDILTGSEDNTFAQRRLQGCRNAFLKRGLPFDEGRVHYGNFWYDSGYYLAQRYLSGELPLPQAVVCTNDCMAYELCDVLSSAGVRIPEDVTVTGYDCTGGRIYHNPVVTTYRSGRHELGIEAANLLLSTDYAEEPQDRFMRGNTCTCGVDPSELNSEIKREHFEHPGTFVSNLAQFSTAQFTQELTLSRTLWEYLSVVNSYAVLHEADSLCFCLDRDWGGAEYVGEEYLCCRMDGAAELSEPLTVSGGALPNTLSGLRDTPSVYYICPLCFQTRLYGYTVFMYEYPDRFRYQLRSWNQIVSNALEFLRLKNDIHYLTLCQRTSSLYDSLTGFCRLTEFRRQAEEAAERSGGLLGVRISFTSDKEQIYDSNRKNDIISAVARAIKQVCTNHESCCRTEGDVFLILCSGQREVIAEKLRVILHREIYVKYCDNPPIITLGERERCSAKEADFLISSVEAAAQEAVSAGRSREELSQYQALIQLRRTVAARPQSAPDIDTASRRLCVSKGYFRAIYKSCFGVSYVQDCINEKLLLAEYLLCTTVMSVYSVALQCGYSDEKYFARQFHQNVGCSPLQYRKKHCGTVSV